MLIHILTSFTKEEAQNIPINYIRVLGFNKKGQQYLNKIKKETNTKLITNYKKNISPTLDIELRVANIYYLPQKNEFENEFKNTIIIKKTVTNKKSS